MVSLHPQFDMPYPRHQHPGVIARYPSRPAVRSPLPACSASSISASSTCCSVSSTIVFSRSRSSANSRFSSSAVIFPFALSCFRVTCHLSFLQPLTEFERSSLTHLLFAESLKLNHLITTVPSLTKAL